MRKFLTFLTLLTLSVGVGWAADQTITLAQSDFTTLSNSYSTATTTKGGFGFKIANGMKNSTNIQMNNKNNGLPGQFTNTTAISGLKSIRVNITSGKFKVATGTSETPTSYGSEYTSSQTVNATSGDTYFTIQVNGATYISSVVITYDDSGSTPQPTYSVNLNQTTGGTISASPTTAAAGTTVTLTATPDTGYDFTSWTVLDENLDEVTVTNNQFTMPASDVEVEATFTAQSSGGSTMTYTTTSSSAGTLSGAPSGVTASQSGFTSFTSGQGAQRTKNGTATITFSNLPTNYKVTKIVVSYTTNSSSGAGTISATLGGSNIGSSYTVSTSGGTTPRDATIYDNSTGTAFSGNLVISTAVTANSVYINGITIYYEQIQEKAYDVTVATGLTGGSVSADPVGTKVVDSGDEIEVTATPATGYALSAWNITGVSETMASLGTTNPATVHATGNVNVSATFVEVPAAATPTFSVAAGTYEEDKTVTITSATSGATIYYTTDGNDPTTSSSSIANGGTVTITSSCTLKAIAVASGYSNSAVAEAAYVINKPKEIEYSEGLVSSQGDFTINNVSLGSLTEVWKTSQYGMTANGHNTTSAIESWFISPLINGANVPSGKTIALDFKENLRFFAEGAAATEATLWWREKNGQWQQLTISEHEVVDGNDFWDVDQISLAACEGKVFQIGYKYTATSTNPGRWEIKNFKVSYEDLKTITLTQPSHGTIAATVGGNAASTARTGDMVTLTYTSADGYGLQSWTVTDANSASVTVTENNGTYTFTMPASNVTVTATVIAPQAINRTILKSGGSCDPDNEQIGWLGNWSGYYGTINATSAVGYPVNATPGATVTFTAGTEEGYQILEADLTVTYSLNGTTTTVSNLTKTRNGSNLNVSFTMPAAPVQVTANFTYYRPTLKIAGSPNGRTTFVESPVSSLPEFTYTSGNDTYSIDVYFTGQENNDKVDYFYLVSDGNAVKPSADGNFWINNGTTQSFSRGSSNFRITPGVYTITVNGALNQITATPKVYSITFDPASGNTVDAGTSVTATCAALASDIAAIKQNDSGAAGTVTVTCDPSTLNTVGSNQEVTATAAIGNYSVTGTASYTVQRVNNSKTYRRTNTLTVGKKYIIVNEGAEVGFKTGGNEESIMISDHQTTLSAESTVIEFTLGGESGAYTFINDSKYLQHSSGNVVNVASTDVKTWDVSIDNSYDVTMKANADNYYLRYNSGATGNRFRAYTANTTADAVQLYEQVAQGAYTITVSGNDATKGSVSVVDNANEGDPITVTVTTESGWACTGITVTPTTAGVTAPTVTNNGVGTFSFTMPASNVTITPTYEAAIAITYVNKYIDNNGVEQTGNTGGTVTGPAGAVEGSTVNVTVTPANGYQLQANSLKYSWNNGAGESPVGGNGTTVPYFFTMPGTPTTVTAVFEKKPYTFTVVSANGSVTGLPASAVSGTSVTFGVTPDAGYAVTGVAVTWEEGEQSGTVPVTDNGDGTYTFDMVPYNVTITVSYFAGDEYELLTNYSDINENDTYLIVGGPTDGTKTYVMGNTLGDSRLDAVALTSSNYVNDKILSTSDMSIIQFVAGTGDNAGKWAIYDNSLNAYLNATSSGKLATSSTASYGTISIDAEDHNRAHIKTGNNGALYLSFNNGNSKMFRFYSSELATTYIFKVANANKVKRPTVTGIGTAQNIGKYNFIGRDTVTIECATPEASIEYSLDGGTTWNTYSAPFEITTNAAGNTVQVLTRATKTGMEPSDAVTATFTCIKPQAPTFGSNEAGAYVNPVFVYPKSALNDRRAYGEQSVSFAYTTTGTAADASSPAVTTSNSNGYYILLDDNATLSVVTIINGIASDPAGGAYTFSVDAPTFSLPGGNYDGDQTTRLSTETKTTQNDVTWETKMYYTFGNTEFSVDQTTGEVSGGWTLYDAGNDPYVTIEAPGTKTLRAVTVANYFNGKTEWHQSAVSEAVYVLSSANLSVTVTPAPGTYTYAQNVTFEPKNAIGEVTILYDLTWDSPDANHVNVSTGTYSGPITIDRDATITILAEDSRDANAEGKTFTGEYVYKIGVQGPVFSPLPGDYYTGDDNDITVEMFSVSPNAKIYYTTDGSTPSKTNGTLYTGDIPLTKGTHTFKAIAYVGNKASSVSEGTYTIGNKLSGNYWQNIAEMNADTDHSTAKTLANPVQVVYMSLYRNGDGSTSYVEPEFAFVRDNSGYGLIYFGAGNIAMYEDYTVFQMGDWLPGGTITGKPVIWEKGFMNELGGGVSTSARVTAWPSTALSNTAIIPEETTNARIIEGWNSKGTAVSGTSATMLSHVVADKNMFGHYVHLRKNTITNVTGSGNGNGKHTGLIEDESGEILNYYDGMYLYSGYDRQGSGVESPDYDQTEFDKVQNKGGTYDVYAVVSFYSDNAAKALYDYVPFQVFPIDFEYTFPPVFHMGGTTYDEQTQEVTIHETKTVTLTCDKEGAQIWYKTSEMEDYEVYESPITVDKTMTIETYSSYPSKYNDYLESKVYTLIVNLGEVPAPVISPESSLNAVGDPAINVTIGFEAGVEVPEGITIYYTTDDSDPSTSETRMVYVPGETTLSISTTTTVRAIAFLDDFYSAEAEERVYTFVRSNGIIYTLVTSDAELDENSVYVVVNQAEAMSMQRTQKENNRDAAPVLFVTNENKPAGHTFAGDLKEVYGNDDLAVFTMRPTGTGEWYFHTANGVNNASTGFLYGAVSGSTNQLKTNTADSPTGVQNINWTIEIDADGTAHMFSLYNDQPRYLRFNKSFGLYNTYGSESTGLPVYLYKKVATPLALIEKMGTTEAGHNQYTIADELEIVAAYNNLIWVKDADASIARTEIKDGQIDYMRDVAASGTYEDLNNMSHVVLKQEGEWDQSNWAIIELPAGDGGNDFVGCYIKPATLTVTYVDNVNYRLVAVFEQGTTLSSYTTAVPVANRYVPNVYCAANFMSANLNLTSESAGAASYDGKRHYFFVNPKVQEVVTITYAVWDGTYFVLPKKEGEALNGAGLHGAFAPGWTYNAGGQPTLTVGEAYQFTAVVNKPVNGGSGAPKRIEGTGDESDGTYVVMPMNLSSSGNIVTEVENVKTVSREVVGVEYYNVAGQRSDKPFEGVNIIVTRYDDGTTSTAKVLR